MKFAKGTKVRIRWMSKSGQPRFCIRWWNQVDTVITQQRAHGGTEFQVRGFNWKDWRAVK